MKPLVSICIPTYNGEAYITEALQSAIHQTYNNFEIIISDDASSDATLEIIKSISNKTETTIQLYNHKPNGIGANWNNCVKHAKGDYIKFLFQDDILKPNCIDKMVQCIIKPSIGLIYCKRDFIYEKSTESIKNFIANYSNLYKHWESFKLTEDIISGKVYLQDRMLLNSPKNKIGEPICTLINRDCFKKIGWFNESLKQVLDYEYWYRLMKHYDIVFIDEPLVSFRLHDQQASSLNKKNSVSEDTLLFKEMYKSVFWQLHYKNKLKLLKLFNPIAKSIVAIKKKINGV